MSEKPSGLPPEVPGDPQHRFWYAVLNMCPFIFLPLVALIAILCAIFMPMFRNR
jgi:hypothetical protein